MKRKTTILLFAFVLVSVAAASAPAQTTRDYEYDLMKNRTRATQQVRFTGAAVFNFEPKRALTEERVNIFGRNLPAGDASMMDVAIGGVSVPIVLVSPRVLTIELPSGLAGGSLIVTLPDGTQVDLGEIDVQGVLITPRSADLDYEETQQFVAMVIGAGSQAVTWYVNDIEGGNSSVGTIDGTGFYTAPSASAAADFPFLVKAVSIELNLSGYARVTLKCDDVLPINDEEFRVRGPGCPLRA